ncbi:MAG: hypothetical protein O7H41_16340 [Planctomycetota bacterium]|nr:hypothetical protein [Planctomycetota bacterium]
MEVMQYTFDGEARTLQISEGDPNRPVVVLLHGTSGNRHDMMDPATNPDHNFDHQSPLSPDKDIGWRSYPGIGITDVGLDAKKPVRSWQDALEEHGFSTVAYDQVDPEGLLERPVRELDTVMMILIGRFRMIEPRFVLLAHSRGGLLVRSYLKTRPRTASWVSHVITLHSPHDGSRLANVANSLRDAIDTLESVAGSVVDDALGWLMNLVDTDAYRELAVNSPFLVDLRQGEAPVPGVSYFTFGGTSVRYTRIIVWHYTLGSAFPQWHWPPFFHRTTAVEMPIASPIADSLPNLTPEVSEGSGDLLTADSNCRLPFGVHTVNQVNHAEALWDRSLQSQVLRILGVMEEPNIWQ